MKTRPGMTTGCWTIFALLAAGLPLGAAGPTDDGGDALEPIPVNGVATISPDELERGQKGWGLSVFAGTEPERFEVEVLGVTHNSTPELSYIMARLTGKDLERSGVIGGMSGSPVYFDGKLAGAVAYSYLFGLDAIAGITPIEPMWRLGEVSGTLAERETADGRQEPAAAWRTAAPPRHPVAWEDLVKREFEAGLLEEQLAMLRPPALSGTRTAVQWSAGGFGETSRQLLANALGGIVPGGTMGTGTLTSLASSTGLTGTTGDAGDLTPGSSVAAVLINGDLHIAGYGTVTDRRGDELLAFGHPFFALGPISMPMAPSEVVTVVASRANSFKIANVGSVVGAFDEDREAGLHGRLGLEAPMIPVDVHLGGLVDREYHMEVLDVPQLTPTMVALSALGSLESASFSSGYQGIDLEARFRLAGHDDLVIRQSFDNDRAGIDSVLYLLAFGAFLTQNDLAEVAIEGVEVEYSQVDRPRLATLVSVHADRTEVAPGETVKLFVELQAYRGGRYRRTVETTVPDDVADGRYVLFVGDGTSMDALRLMVEQRVPQTFEQALGFMRSFRSRGELRIFGLAPGPGLAVAGEVLPQLPGSMRAVFAAGPPDTVPLNLAIVHEETETQDRPIAGLKRLDLRVRRR